MNTRCLSDLTLLTNNVPLPPERLPARIGQKPAADESVPTTTIDAGAANDPAASQIRASRSRFSAQEPRQTIIDNADPNKAILDAMENVPVEMRRPLHRLRAVRKTEQVSRRNLARKLKTTVTKVLQQEDPNSDMTLSTLYQWQHALGVPVAELLVEQNEDLSQPILKRSRMVRLMKTAQSIQELSSHPRVRRMTENLINQLIEIMPDLQDVGPWPLVGQRRSLSELGRAVERYLPTSALLEDE